MPCIWLTVCPETSGAISTAWLPLVIPAKAGIQGNRADFRVALDPGLRRGDGILLKTLSFISDRYQGRSCRRQADAGIPTTRPNGCRPRCDNGRVGALNAQIGGRKCPATVRLLP